MKNYLIITFLFLAISSFAQEQKATLYFKDGSIKSGYEKIKKDKIKFKSNLESKKTIYDYKTVDSICIRENNNDVTFYYKEIKNKNKSVLLQVLAKGKVTLFTNIYTIKSGFNVYQVSRDFITNNSPHLNPDIHLSPNISFNINSSVDYYYIQKQNETFVTYLGQWGDPYLGKSLKKGVLDYFNDCPELISKIRNKEYYRDEIIKIIEFYNEYCK